MTEITDSRFNMWRSVTRLAHADHTVTGPEKDMMMTRITKLPFSDEQRNQLIEDLEKPSNLSAVLSRVTKAADRGILIHFARLMVWSDGEYAAQEERLMTILRENAVHQADIDKLIETARANAATETDAIMIELERYKKEERDEIFAPFRWLFDLLD